MPHRDPAGWMLSEAIGALARAERMHRELCRPQHSAPPREPAWEPPLDMLETEEAILIRPRCPWLIAGLRSAVVRSK